VENNGPVVLEGAPDGVISTAEVIRIEIADPRFQLRAGALQDGRERVVGAADGFTIQGNHIDRFLFVVAIRD